MTTNKKVKLDPYIDEVLAESLIELTTKTSKTIEMGIKRLTELDIDVTDLEKELKQAKAAEKTAKKELKKAF